jgi:hypothetical protein
MAKKWNPWKSPPAGDMEFSDWLAEDMAAFVRANPDLPQKPISKLNAKENNLVVTAYEEQRDKMDLDAARRKKSKTAKSSTTARKTGTTVKKPAGKKR